MSSGLFARFVTLYYAHLALDDSKERSAADLEGAARAHLRFGEERKPGEPLVRVYNPTFDQDGYDSTHTIVDIVTDDMPFLVDSVGMELTRHGLGIHLVVHPIIAVRRDSEGKLTDLDEDAPREAFMHFEVDRETDAALLESLRRDLLRVLGDVRAAVDDWEAMRDKALAIAGSLTDPDDAEAAALLRWMADDHFTFLGYLEAETGASLGISRGAEVEPSGRRRRRTHCEEGRRARHRAPTGPHGAGVRRAQRVPRALDLRGVQHLAARHPASAPQGRCGARPLRASPRLALREGPRIDPRHVPARRAVPDQ